MRLSPGPLFEMGSEKFDEKKWDRRENYAKMTFLIHLLFSEILEKPSENALENQAKRLGF